MGNKQNTENSLQSAWNLLIDKYQPGLEKRAGEIWLGDKNAIDMAIQNVWVETCSTFDHTDCDLEPYLYACLEDQWRKNLGL